MTHSEQINELAGALAKAQSAVKGAAKDKSNPHYKNDYADLASVWDACREPLTKNGLSIVQTTEPSDGTVVTVHTTLLHSSGQWMKGCLTMKPQKVDPQGIGSCITYARRYALAAMVGVAPEDDDGNAASERGTHQTQTVAKPAGFDLWWVGLQKAADKGTPDLQRAWDGGTPEMRTYVGAHKNDDWLTMKAKARKVAA